MSVTWKDSLLNFFFPPACLICRERLETVNFNYYLCDYCRESFLTAGWVCPACQLTGQNGTSCLCKGHKRVLKNLYCLAWYEGGWRKVIHRFKYYGKAEMAVAMGKMIGQALLLSQNNIIPDIITPVPLYRRKELERGYNQASLLAQNVGKEMKLPFYQLLTRIKDTASQTSLSGKERKLNVRDAFIFNGRKDIKGKSILLIDDVYTTGSTMKEAGRTLIAAGAREVNGAVAAIQGI